MNRVEFSVNVLGGKGTIWIDGQKIPMTRDIAALLMIRLKQMYPSIEEVV